MEGFSDFILTLLSQFAGGPGQTENNLIRYGLAAVLWAVLFVTAWSRQRQQELPREKWLVWGFGLGFAREFYMFGHVALQMAAGLEDRSGYFFSEPLEHTLSMAALIVVAGAYLRYILNDATFARRFLRAGIGATLTSFCVVTVWWASFTPDYPTVKFHQTWGAWWFHIIVSGFLLTAIVLMIRQRGWLKNVVSAALFFFLLSEILILLNFATDKAFGDVLCPIGNAFHILAIPMLGYVYIQELFIENKQATQALQTYQNHLEELVAERTVELTTEIHQRKLVELALAELSQRSGLILNSAGEGIIEVDIHGNHTFVNAAAENMLGFAADELIGLPSHSTWHHTKPDGTPYPESECPLHAGYQSGTVCRGDDQVFWRKDGTSFPVSYISTPILERGKLMGAVLVFQDITARKRAEFELTGQHARLAAQNAIAATISQSLDLNTMLDNALDTALKVLDMDVGGIYLLDTNGHTMNLHTCRIQSQKSTVSALPLCADISSQAINKQAPILFNVSKRLPGHWPAADAENNLQCVISTPLVANGVTLGALTVGTYQSNAVPPQNLNMLMAVGQQFGMAVENGRLHQQTERWAERLALLHAVSENFSATTDPAAIFEQMTEQAAKLLDCRIACTLHWDPAEQIAVGVSHYGLSDSNHAEILSEFSQCQLVGRLAAGSSRIVIQDAQTNSQIEPHFRQKFNIKALLGLPVKTGQESTLGFLFVIDSHKPRYWPADEIQLVQSFVHRSAIALENAQLHQQVQRSAAIEERQRIASNMHDGLAQTLSYLGYKIDYASQLAVDGNTQALAAEYHAIRATIDQAAKEVRQSIASLRENPRPNRSLQEWLQEIVEQHARKSASTVQFESDLVIPLFVSPAQVEQVLRVVKEALLNATRHANAQRVSVRLTQHAEMTSITVSDNGQGFDPHLRQTDGEHHFGLSIMHARAARIGGTIEIESAPGKGTRVTLIWPVGDNASGPKSPVAHFGQGVAS